VTSTEASFLTGYLPYLLRQADQTLSAPFYAVLTRCGVARSDWRVLSVLEELGQRGVADLAHAALSPQPTVTHAVRRLETRGLVARTQGTKDRRQRLVSITPTGSSLTTRLIEEAKHLETEALAEAGDLSELVARLQELTAIVEATIQGRAGEAAEAGRITPHVGDTHDQL
jgi:DNA-binding MarR family transcriptional regulator